MSKLAGTQTHENLKAAFAGESQANRRYLWMAKRADIEGYPEVAGNFRDSAEGETGHAHGHLDYLKSVGDPATGLPIGATEDNLKSAVAGEPRASPRSPTGSRRWPAPRSRTLASSRRCSTRPSSLPAAQAARGAGPHAAGGRPPLAR